jgi:hypothetical protein
MKIHPVINVEYLRKYHESPERLGARENVVTLNKDDLIGEPQMESIRASRLVRGQPQFLVHYAGTAEHDDV